LKKAIDTHAFIPFQHIFEGSKDPESLESSIGVQDKRLDGRYKPSSII
jgi:hypothetical protein